MFKRELQGALVGPWMLFGRDSRIVTLFGQIYSSIEVNTITGESTPFLAEETVGAMMLLADESRDSVKLVINNRGGSMAAALLIISAIEHLESLGIEIEVFVIGSSMSAATWILAAGSAGKRYAWKRSLIHLAKPNTPNLRGLTPEDAELVKKHNDKLRESVYRLLAEKTKLPECCWKRAGEEGPCPAEPEVRQKLVATMLGESDLFLSPEEALEYGLVDRVFNPGDRQVNKIFRVPGKHKDVGFGEPKRKEVSR